MATPAPDAPLETLHEGRFLSMVRRGRWEYVARRNTTGVVIIIALTPEDRLILVEQYRPPVGTRVIELPAGLAGDIAGSEHEDLSVAAVRELEEETGWTAASMTRVAAGPVSAGLTSEVVTFFRADGLARIGPGGGDPTEDIIVHEILRADLPAWIAAREAEGMLVDPKVWVALLFATAMV